MTADRGSLLRKELAELNAKGGEVGFSVGLVDDENPFFWKVMMEGPIDTFFEGGYFKAEMHFPHTYPDSPPKMRFISEMWHPNIAHSGDIPILRQQSKNKSAESIIMSVISMLSSPNDEAPANADAWKEWRNDYHGAFKQNVFKTVEKSVDAL